MPYAEAFKQSVHQITENILNPEEKGFNEEFEKTLNELDNTEITRISEIIENNRLSIPVSNKLELLNSPNALRLKEALKPQVESTKIRKKQRNTIMQKISNLLECAQIDYSIFKTINNLDSIGVDIDLIIPPESYEDCIDGLLSNGFYSIDDLEKKYATGFMYKGNPIILDLHTDLAILGVRYFNPCIMLAKKHSVETTDSSGDSYSINLVDDVLNTVIMMIHCVIKESTIRIDEIAEIRKSVQKNPDSVRNLAYHQKHQLTTSIFSQFVKSELELKEFAGLTNFNDSFTHNLSKKILQNRTKTTYPPYKLPVSLSIVTFLNHLRERNQLADMTKILYNLGFERNAAHLGKKILGNL